MSITTQYMRFRQSLMKYAQKFGVSRVSRKYNKGKSYISSGLPDMMELSNHWPAVLVGPMAIPMHILKPS